MDRLIDEMDDLAAQIGAEEPWAHPLARDLDTVSFKQWLINQSDDAEARDNIGLFIAGGMLTKPAHSFSALQAVLMAASAGSFSHLVDEDFILDKRVIGGMQQVSIRMAEALGDDVFLNAPVRTVKWNESGATVLADGDVRVEASRVILAVPPNLYSRISYDPRCRVVSTRCTSTSPSASSSRFTRCTRRLSGAKTASPAPASARPR